VIVLGIDTSGYTNAVGISNGDRVLAEAVFSARTDSLEQIVANIDEVSKSAGLTLDKVQGIGVGLGPGSWTGIRVGVTVGKMLAFASGKPVCGVPTLEILAYAVKASLLPVYAVISVGVGDAVYAARYCVKDAEIVREGDYYIGGIKGLAALIKGPCVLVGKEARVYAEVIQNESEVEVNAVEIEPSGAIAACLAARRLARGESDDALSLAPLYLKESTAKVFINKYQINHEQRTDK
jgi:tRNA threonylcarbamoyladenosine biosynthesis protein TsaB